MVLRQWKPPLTFLPRPLGDMFCKSEGLVQSGTHILSYCADSFAIKVCPPIGLYRLRRYSGASRLVRLPHLVFRLQRTVSGFRCKEFLGIFPPADHWDIRQMPTS